MIPYVSMLLILSVPRQACGLSNSTLTFKPYPVITLFSHHILPSLRPLITTTTVPQGLMLNSLEVFEQPTRLWHGRLQKTLIISQLLSLPSQLQVGEVDGSCPPRVAKEGLSPRALRSVSFPPPARLCPVAVPPSHPSSAISLLLYSIESGTWYPSYVDFYRFLADCSVAEMFVFLSGLFQLAKTKKANKGLEHFFYWDRFLGISLAFL